MIRGKLDLMCNAELYKRYKMWEETEGDSSEYLFDCEDRLDKLKEYYSQRELELHSIGEISDCLTYGYRVNNDILDNGTLKIKCNSVDENNIEFLDELAEYICHIILIVSDCNVGYIVNRGLRNIIIEIDDLK